jgi:hypothetical protein
VLSPAGKILISGSNSLNFKTFLYFFCRRLGGGRVRGRVRGRGRGRERGRGRGRGKGIERGRERKRGRGRERGRERKRERERGRDVEEEEEGKKSYLVKRKSKKYVVLQGGVHEPGLLGHVGYASFH